MPHLFFPDADTLRRTLITNALPHALTHSPAQAGVDLQGRLWIEPEAELQREAIATLQRLGVRVFGSSAAMTYEPIYCWHQRLPLESIAEDAPEVALFELPIHELARFDDDMRRLRPQRMGYRQLDETHVVVRVVRPPYWLLSRAADPAESLAAYVEQVERVWVPYRMQHPLGELIQPMDHRTLLVRVPYDWRYLEGIPIVSEYGSYPLRPAAVRLRSTTVDERVSVQPRLLPQAGDALPEMWIIEDEPLEQLDELIRTSEERLLARLSFALLAWPKPAIMLRVRPSKAPPPILTLNARGYAPFQKLPLLFMPVGYQLRPFLRRDALRELMDYQPQRLTWLQPLPDGDYRIGMMPESAFEPLVDWIDYHLEAEPVARQGWLPADRFRLEAFELAPDEVGSSVPNRATLAPAVTGGNAEENHQGMLARLRQTVTGWLRKSTLPHESITRTPTAGELNVDRTLERVYRQQEAKKVVAEDRPGESQQRRQALESKILVQLGRVEGGGRIEDWEELAGLYRRVNNHPDAALCWLNAIWEQPHAHAHTALGWLNSELKGIRSSTLDVGSRDELTDLPIERWLKEPPTPGHVRSMAAYIVWAGLVEPMPTVWLAHLDQLQHYLDQHENWLPLRAVWLLRCTLARLQHGDVLSLARCRDRLHERMQEGGMSLDLDVPSFLRFAMPGVSERFQKVRDWLKRLREPIKRWLAELAIGRTIPRGTTGDPVSVRIVSRISEFGLDPELQFTPAYVDLILAWGLSRLSEHHAGRDLLQHAAQVLNHGDPVHEVLLEAYRYRIRQAQEGRAAKGPLPPELLRRIAALEPETGTRVDPRYVVDKLRQHSRIIEPSERLDAYRTPLRYHTATPELRQELLELDQLPETREVDERVRRLLGIATRTSDRASLPSVVLKMLDLAGRLSENVLLLALREVKSAVELCGDRLPEQVRLLEQAIFIAVQIGQAGIVRELLAQFMGLLEGRRGVQMLKSIEALTGESFRGLQRLGLRSECEQFLQKMETWVLGGHDLKGLREKQPKEWPIALRTLLHIATGWFFCGQDDRANATLNEARDQLLYQAELPASEQTALALTYAATLGYADPRIALGRLEELFQRLRNVQLNSTTNSHYMLKPLELIETAVRAVVNESFTLGPTVRRWLDDDEYLVRRRIDQDVAVMMANPE